MEETESDEFSDKAISVEICWLQRDLRTARINSEETKTWAILQVLEFIIKWDFYKYLQNLSVCLRLSLYVYLLLHMKKNILKLKFI